MRVHGGNEDRHIGPGGGSGDVITVVKIVYSLYHKFYTRILLVAVAM